MFFGLIDNEWSWYNIGDHYTAFYELNWVLVCKERLTWKLQLLCKTAKNRFLYYFVFSWLEGGQNCVFIFEIGDRQLSLLFSIDTFKELNRMHESLKSLACIKIPEVVVILNGSNPSTLSPQLCKNL